jgi:hypothetical protein
MLHTKRNRKKTGPLGFAFRTPNYTFPNLHEQAFSHYWFGGSQRKSQQEKTKIAFWQVENQSLCQK